MPTKKKTAPFTPPEDMDQATADDLADLHETNPDLFPDRTETDPADADTAGEDPLEPDFVMVDGEEEHPDPDTPQEPAETPMEKAKRILGHYALQKAVVQHIEDVVGDQKDEVMAALQVLWEQAGAKSYEVTVPTMHGERVKIAQATLVLKEEDVKVDDAHEFTDWLVANRPELVRTKHHPATDPVPAMPAWDEEVPAPDAVKVLMEQCKVEVREEETTRGTRTVREIVDPATGDIVPGLRHVPARPPESMRLSWGGPGSPLKARALDLLVHNELDGISLTGILPLPQIEQ